MAVRSVSRTRISDQVFQQIKELIAERKWNIGDRIPPETRLMEMFGVSRITIREAIRQLVRLGMLETRQGSGTYVKSYHEAPFSQDLYRLPSRQDLIELLEMRRGVEVECAGLAAQRATEKDIERLQALCRDMEPEEITAEENSMLDMKYHITIAQATQNKYIIELMESIAEPLLRFFDTTVFLNFSRENGLQRHKHILEAIKGHNVQEARLIMELHLNDTIRIINESLDEIAIGDEI